jgi:hypothetical protein
VLRGVRGTEISRSVQGKGLMDGFGQNNLYHIKHPLSPINHCGANVTSQLLSVVGHRTVSLFSF